jgi:excinuclease ABC subunit C
MDDIRLKLKTLPNKPGIYQYYDKNNKILYVGKAKDLKKRVSSYFNKNQDSGKTRVLVKQIYDIRYIVVDTEKDALLLENSLIKKYQPKYNIHLKDDKTYPWIVIRKELYPRMFMTRKVIKDGSEYFGPYTSVKTVKTLMDMITSVVPLRTCSHKLTRDRIAEGKFKSSVEYYIGNCQGACQGEVTEEEYKELIDQAKHIIRGNFKGSLKKMEAEMKELSANLEYEKAQDLKERIDILKNYEAKSTVVSSKIEQVDVITVLQDQKSAYVNYLVVNNGAIIHGLTVEVAKKLDETEEEIINYVLPEMRDRFNSQSREVLVEKEMGFGTDEYSYFMPHRGDKKALVDLSKRNAKFFKLEKLKHEKIVNPESHVDRILEQIRVDFRLKDKPVHIECFDNSNFQGTNAVSACVVFRNGKPSKKDYRHFNIKTVEGPDDFASMEEAVYRRYKRLLDEEKSLPQLIVIDGGKGQLSASLKALDDLGIRKKVAIVGIAKKLEEIFFPGDTLPIYIDKRSESLKVIQHMRNEAHRFGITHHRNKRSKNALISEITQIKGIGEKTYEELIKVFKSVKGVKSASEEDLIETIGPAKAKIVLDYFANQES